MKGYLKSLDGVFQLGPHITTIGRDGCDLIVQAVNIDYRHALIEFNERESTFALQDLNSIHGTFVNDVQARSAAVPLSPGDIVRFGHPGVLFQFMVDFQKETSVCLPLDKRPNYLAAHPVPPQVIYKDGLPQLRAASNPDSFNDGNGEIDPEEEPHWIIGPGQNYLEACEEAMSHEDENLELVVQCLKDEVRRLQVFESECMFKDDLIDQLKDEVAYLQVKLRQFEVGSLKITGHDQLNCTTGAKMLQLETKTAATETQEQKFRIYQMSSLIISPQEDPAVPSVASHDSSQPPLVEVDQQSSEGVVEPTAAPPICSPVEEPKATPPSSSAVEEPKAAPPTGSSVEEPKAVLSTSSAVAPEQGFEDLKRELNRARGLLFRMQENFASKDTTITKLAKEAGNLREEIVEKDQTISALREIMQQSSEDIEQEEEIVKREKELLLLQKKLKNSSTQQSAQSTLLESLKAELQSLKKSAEMDRLALRKLQKENEQNLVKILDLERQERSGRIEVEQLNKSLEKFRSRLIQSAHSQLNVKTPNKKFTDDDLLLAVNKCCGTPSPADSSSKNQLPTPSTELLATPTGSSNNNARIDRNVKK